VFANNLRNLSEDNIKNKVKMFNEKVSEEK